MLAAFVDGQPLGLVRRIYVGPRLIDLLLQCLLRFEACATINDAILKVLVAVRLEEYEVAVNPSLFPNLHSLAEAQALNERYHVFAVPSADFLKQDARIVKLMLLKDAMLASSLVRLAFVQEAHVGSLRDLLLLQEKPTRAQHRVVSATRLLFKPVGGNSLVVLAFDLILRKHRARGVGHNVRKLWMSVLQVLD